MKHDWKVWHNNCLAWCCSRLPANFVLANPDGRSINKSSASDRSKKNGAPLAILTKQPVKVQIGAISCCSFFKCRAVCRFWVVWLTGYKFADKSIINKVWPAREVSEWSIQILPFSPFHHLLCAVVPGQWMLKVFAVLSLVSFPYLHPQGIL